MKLSRFSVQRPVFTIMASLIVIILGAVAWTRLPIDLMPDITYPTLSISAEYENASPEEIEELITRPLEEALTAVPGVEEVTSVSAEGRSNVRVTFTWGTDLDSAANDVRDRLDRVMPRLPDGTDKPTLRKFDLASFPVLILGASSDIDPIQMRKILEDQVKYRIERVPGVAAMDIHGGLEREIHVNLSPEKINALGLPLDLIINRIKEGNINLPAGTLERGSLDVRIRTPGIYISLEELGETVVAVREGVPVQLRDVASIEDSWEKITRIVRVNGRPGIRLVVNKQSGKNTVEVASGVLREIERINHDIPQIQISSIIDTSDYIKRSISNVGSSILYGGILAIFVLLLFLRNIPSTAIIATAIPISIIAAFGLIYFGGFTLNLMTMGGLALGIGMLVDNAIVVLENIYRHRESGNSPRQAAITGSEEVSAAVIASTLTTLAVFMPLIFVRGMSGIMFKQFAFIVGFSLACSLAVALTLVPMLASRMLTPTSQGARVPRGEKKGEISGHGLNFKTGMEERYRQLLHLALAHRKTVVIGSVLLMAGSIGLIPLVGVEFMPSTDESEVRVYGEMEVGTKLDVVARVFERIESVIKNEVPETRNMVSLIGGTSWRARGSHSGEIRIALKPVSERDRSSEEIARDLRNKLSKIPGMMIRTREGQGLFILRMGTQTGEKVQVEIRGHDLEKADILAQSVKTVVEDVDGITDVQISRESGSPEELIIVDRQKAADLKITVSHIANMLQTVLSGTGAGNYRESGDEYRILVKLEEAEQKSLREILDLTLVNSDGETVVLRNLVQVIPRTGPVLIERKDQERTVTISANISGRDMGSILTDIRKALRTLPLPGDFSIVFAGDYEEQQKAFRELLLGFALSLILVYMVMASLYESLRDPFVVMFSVPLATIGVILMLLITGTTFNVQSYIGCIMLGGIVVNNAILLVDHINLLRRKEAMPLREAIEEAGRRRLRPILMTAATTMLALVPLAIGLGEGGEAQAPMARAVIGGLLSSTFITLIFVPVIYAVFESRLEKKKSMEAPAENEVK
ncbi:MAG TPA: efflux RND transporter permease subunit [Desulfobacteraceae bacterium]|nr:efflux RND transporter permease subunit [Desulfobacteraceae bacterium]